jgi:hypothetical protein
MVNGTLQAWGNYGNPVTFDGGQITFTQYSTSWNASTGSGSIIVLSVLSSSMTLDTSPLISNNIITSGISVEEGMPTISNNTIYGGISVADGVTPTIKSNTILGNGINLSISNETVLDNTISGCSVAITADIDAPPPDWINCTSLIEGNLIVNNTNGINIIGIQGTTVDSPLIQNNTITNNTIGIYLGWERFSGVAPAILNNNIYNNRNYNVEESVPNNDINATYNWWGTTDASAINQTIYDFKNDFNLGVVSFVPFLTAPNPLAPKAPLTFTVVASSGAVDQGQTSTLSVSGLFGGSTPYSYQWFEMAPSGSYATVGTNSPNFNFVTLGSNRLPPVTSTGSWSFILQVTDSVGAAVNSTAVSVTVNTFLTAPFVSASPSTVDQGQISSLTSNVVTTGTPPYTYQWYSKVNESSYSYINGATSSSYSFSTSDTTARGTWSFILQVTDNTGAATNATATTVTVNPALAAPTVTTSPSTVIQGQTSSLTSTNFSPTGTFPFTYQWFERAPGGNYATVGTGIPNFSFATSDSTATGGWSFILQITDSTGAEMNSTATLVTVNAPAASPTPTPIPTATSTQEPSPSPTPTSSPTSTSTATPSISPTASPLTTPAIPEFPVLTIPLLLIIIAVSGLLVYFKKHKH